MHCMVIIKTPSLLFFNFCLTTGCVCYCLQWFGTATHAMRSVGAGFTYSLTLFRGVTSPYLNAMLTYDAAFTACFYVSLLWLLFVFVFGVILAALSSAYARVKAELFYHSTVETRDYEMVDFMLKRFKRWLKIDSKEKPVGGAAHAHRTLVYIQGWA